MQLKFYMYYSYIHGLCKTLNVQPNLNVQFVHVYTRTIKRIFLSNAYYI